MISIESLDNALARIDAINRRFGIKMNNTRPRVMSAAGKADKNGKTAPAENSFQAELKKAEEEFAQTGTLKPIEGATIELKNNQTRKPSQTPINLGETSDLINAAARQYNVDARLVSAVAEVESGGDQSAVSSVGAIGVMQLMPETAAALGVNPYDKKQNIEGGAKYIRQMLDTFNGDVTKAVAAYNAGPQAVKDYGGVPPYRETQNYVNKVLDMYW